MSQNIITKNKNVILKLGSSASRPTSYGPVSEKPLSETDAIEKTCKQRGKITDELKNRIAKHLSMAAKDVIITSSSDDGLYQVSSSNPKDVYIRGRVLDTRFAKRDGKGIVNVARGFGFPSEFVADSIEMDNGKVMLKNDGKHVPEWKALDAGRVDIFYGLEGTLLMVVLWNDRMYIMTQNNIFAETSCWPGRSEYFADMYQKHGGPDRNKLFGEAKYSPYCHLFILAAPEVTRASKINFKGLNRQDGFVSYVGGFVMWSADPTDYAASPYKFYYASLGKPAGYDTDPRPDAGNIDEVWQPALSEETSESLKLESGDTNKPYYSTPISVEHATDFLQTGYYSKKGEFPRDYPQEFCPGEFVVMFEYDDAGNIERVYNINSPAYTWRRKVTGDDSSMLLRYLKQCDLAKDAATNEESLKLFNELYGKMLKAPLSKEHVNTFINQNWKAVFWPFDTEYIQIPDINMSRRQAVWNAMILATPLHMSKDVVKYAEDHESMVEMVAQWLAQLYVNDEYSHLNGKWYKSVHFFFWKFKESGKVSFVDAVKARRADGIYSLYREQKKWHRDQEQLRAITNAA
jgi:hypothetical protein